MGVFAELHAPRTAHPFGTFLAEYPGVSVDIERSVPVGDPVHYVWVAGEGHEDLVEDLRENVPVHELTVVDELPDQTLVRFEWEYLESSIFRLVEDVGAMPLRVCGTHDGWTIRLRFSDGDTLTAFYEIGRDQGISLELRRTYEPDGIAGDTEYGLTITQAETLAAAFEAGYFDIPREITLTELAEEFGVSEQAVSERLRRGLLSLLTSTVFDDEPDGPIDDNSTN